MIDLLNQICSVIPPGTASGTASHYYITPTVSTPVSYRCRFIPAGTRVKTDAGYRISSSPTLLLSPKAVITAGYQVTINSITYTVLTVREPTDGAGKIHHYECDLGGAA